MDTWKEEISKYKKDIQEINSKKDIGEYIKLKKLKEERAAIFISSLLTHENKQLVNLAEECLVGFIEGKIECLNEAVDSMESDTNKSKFLEEGGYEVGKKVTRKVINKVSRNEDITKNNAAGEDVSNTDKSAEDIMDFSLREFINNMNELKNENKKLKANLESGNTEITKYKAKAQNDNTEITKLSDKLKVANSIIKEKSSIIADLSTRLDKLEKNLSEKFENLEKEVKKTVPAVDKTKELVDRNNNTLKEILVNVKEERKSLSKLQDLESEIKGIEDKIAGKVIEGIKAVIQNLSIDKGEVYAHNNKQSHDFREREIPSYIKVKDEIKANRVTKEEIVTKMDSEEEDDELSKMLNDIKNVIM